MRKVTELTKEERAAVERVVRILDEFDKLSEQLPVSYMQIFLEIALRPGLGNTEIADRLNKLKGPTSRIINSLGDFPRRTEKSYGLVDKGTDIEDQRRVPVYLSIKGEQLVKKILRAQGL